MRRLELLEVFMSRHVVLGAGPVGRAIVSSLSSRGIKATVISRSGTFVEGASAVAADVLDATTLRSLISGAEAVYQASQPKYHRWPEEFPAFQESIVSAVRGSDAVFVAVENLYGYGPVIGPLAESLPLVATGRKGKVRGDLWQALKNEHDSGRMKVTAGRASDFFGPFVQDSAVGGRYFGSLLKGKKAGVLGNPDALHSYTFVQDFGDALVRLALDDRSLGRAWHVPNAPAVTNQKFLELAAQAIGVEPKSQKLGLPLMKVLGLFNPAVRELPEMLYEWNEDYIVDHSAYASTFGDHATPLVESIATTVDWWRSQAS
jgi:nucleoside-diphosphate-sugar epimerase